jgi:hypothetical protein
LPLYGGLLIHIQDNHLHSTCTAHAQHGTA